MSHAGIASATGTRLDSAAKHTMACKIETDLLVSWFPSAKNALVTLHKSKYKYAMQKDELVLNVTSQMNARGRIVSGAKAYPAVVTSLGDMPFEVKQRLVFMYSAKFGRDFMERRVLSDAEKGSCSKLLLRMWDTMPNFFAQGYALGTAWASHMSGDTVGTVLVGGMVTVRNGAFSCRAGQPIMFYFDFEELEFSNKTRQGVIEGERFVHMLEDGRDTEDSTVVKRRNDAATTLVVDRDKEYRASDAGRKRRKVQEYDTYEAPSTTKCGIALPKPYVLQRGDEHYGDRIRVFAKCINGGRPFDMIDIMLMTQSL